MIWSVVSKEEMGNSTTSPTFGDYSKEIGENNIKLAIVDESDKLDFVAPNDIVLLRTASRSLIESIKKRNSATTAEEFNTYQLALDKLEMSSFLIKRGAKVAPCYMPSRIKEGKEYFVKPRFGNDSNVSIQNVCHSKEEVKAQIDRISSQCNQESVICDNLTGREYTVACVREDQNFRSYPIDVEEPERVLPKNVEEILTVESKKICDALGILHHARIDFRSDSKGELFAIDVNLIPSIGIDGKWAKCFYSAGLTYRASLISLLATATKI